MPAALPLFESLEKVRREKLTCVESRNNLGKDSAHRGHQRSRQKSRHDHRNRSRQKRVLDHILTAASLHSCCAKR